MLPAERACLCLHARVCVCVCICLLVLRPLKCESVSKLLLNCSGERRKKKRRGGDTAGGANGGTITSRLEEEAVVTGTNKNNSVRHGKQRARLILLRLSSKPTTSLSFPCFSLIPLKYKNLIFFFYPLSISPCLTAPTPTSLSLSLS